MKKKFLKDAAITGIVFTLPRVLSFLLLPIYTVFVAPDLLGLMELFVNIFMILQFTFTAEISQALSRFVPLEEDESGKAVVFSTTFWFNLGCWLLICCVAHSFSKNIATLFHTEMVTGRIVILAFWGMLLQSQYQLISLALRFNNKVSSMAVSNFISAIVTSLVTISLLYFTSLRLEALLLAPVVGNFIGFVHGYSRGGEEMRLTRVFDSARLKRMLSYSFPLVLSSAGFYLVSCVDRWLISAMLPLEALGFFSFAFKLASLIAIFTTAVRVSLTPLIYNSAQSPDTVVSVEQLLRLYIAGGGMIIVALETFSPMLLPLVVAATYKPAFVLVAPAACSVLLLNGYVFFPGLDLALKSKTVAIINFSVGVLNLGLNLFLIPRIGVGGALLGSVVSGAFMLALYAILSQKDFPLPFKLMHYVVFIVAGLLVFCSLRFLVVDALLRVLLFLGHLLLTGSLLWKDFGPKKYTST